MYELTVAIQAAKAAGAYIQAQAAGAHTAVPTAGTAQSPGRSPIEAIIKTSPVDLVTLVDKESERIIRTIILEAFPDHEVFGEEGGGATEAESLWIVDPLDGTVNFIESFPFYAVSIALVRDGKVVAGVVYDPIRDECFAAVRGQGATLNGAPIAVDGARSLGEAVIASRTPRDYRSDELQNAEAWVDVAQRVRGMRCMGASTLELAWVAAGRISAFWEMLLMPWDRAAGSLLIEEAGGVVTTPLGEALPLWSMVGALGANPAIHAELVERIMAQTPANLAARLDEEMALA